MITKIMSIAPSAVVKYVAAALLATAVLLPQTSMAADETTCTGGTVAIKKVYADGSDSKSDLKVGQEIEYKVIVSHNGGSDVIVQKTLDPMTDCAKTQSELVAFMPGSDATFSAGESFTYHCTHTISGDPSVDFADTSVEVTNNASCQASDGITGSVTAECGDGYKNRDVEQCDDGNDINDDACTNACTLPSCGDNIVQSGEQCDDGNDVNNDSCTNACTTPVCGDKIVQSGEQCDDGNGINDDSCTNTCKAPVCGDKIVQSGETCDDGNTTSGDGCSNTCQAERRTPSGLTTDDADECETAVIGNRIWLDLDGDGKQDDKEPGIKNIKVKLYDDDGDRIDDDTTSDGGKYEFKDLKAGTYKVVVKEEDVAKYLQTHDPSGSVMNNESTVTVECDEEVTDIDFGYQDPNRSVAGSTERPKTLAKTGGQSLLEMLFNLFR